MIVGSVIVGSEVAVDHDVTRGGGYTVCDIILHGGYAVGVMSVGDVSFVMGDVIAGYAFAMGSMILLDEATVGSVIVRCAVAVVDRIVGCAFAESEMILCCGFAEGFMMLGCGVIVAGVIIGSELVVVNMILCCVIVDHDVTLGGGYAVGDTFLHSGYAVGDMSVGGYAMGGAFAVGDGLRVIFYYSQIQEAAREGARWGQGLLAVRLSYPLRAQPLLPRLIRKLFARLAHATALVVNVGVLKRVLMAVHAVRFALVGWLLAKVRRAHCRPCLVGDTLLALVPGWPAFAGLANFGSRLGRGHVVGSGLGGLRSLALLRCPLQQRLRAGARAYVCVAFSVAARPRFVLLTMRTRSAPSMRVMPCAAEGT
jgi:hypothetical protein